MGTGQLSIVTFITNRVQEMTDKKKKIIRPRLDTGRDRKRSFDRLHYYRELEHSLFSRRLKMTLLQMTIL